MVALETGNLLKSNSTDLECKNRAVYVYVVLTIYNEGGKRLL